ncbi:beta-ketoacyl synthase N-terminal-like domain-containing protein [Streptomyces sp. NPDC046203]|uniref:type I polyketide synthase n=1 Tax=Streptomyces sp. NPDC046203 TaxID=3154602 RepID=UPI0033E03514
MGSAKEETSIAVVGMGCRFPQARNVDEFWSNLVANRDSVTPIPPERFDITPFWAEESGVPGRTASRHGGFLDDPFHFDAGFFGISPAEAASIDPQHRLLLPVVREALDDAGIRPSSLAGTRTGVYIGQATADYGRDGTTDSNSLREAAGSYFRAMASGRVSYDLDLRGPSMMVDTACSSSLVAVHMARQSLLAGETDLVIAGGVNLILSPMDAIAFSQAAMLSPDGRCKFGDTSANGFVRSEGVGVVVLARLEDAERAGYPVLALLPGSAVTNDGRSSGSLIKPAVAGQDAMVRHAWQEAGIVPADLDYIEAHGTGTPVGDGVELQVLATAARERTPERGPLRCGSVKSNIGHAEAAAGIAGLIKSVLVARHGLIPGSLHLNDPQPLLADETNRLRLVTRNERLDTERAAVIGVSSFGLSGTNAHVVVTEADRRPALPERGDPTGLPAGRPTHLLVLSARSEPALRRLAAAWSDHLSPRGEGSRTPLRDLCATAALHRDAHPFRLWATGADHAELAAALRDVADGRATDRAGTGEAGFGADKRTVFVFPGQGSQWPGMGRSLTASLPAFASTLDACDAAVRDETGHSVRETLDAVGDAFPDEVATVQPALWATQVALAAAWRDMGVDPEVCVGHSMGETAAAAVTGALSLADAAAVICRRSALMQRTAGQGAMMSVDLSPERAAELVALEGGVCVAAENAPTSTVLAGDTAALRRIGERLEREGVFHRLVRVNVASHSPAMDQLRDELLAALAGLAPRDGDLPMHSTVLGRALSGAQLDAAYWMDNLRRPVRFLDAVRTLVEEADSVFVEISPHPLLQSAIEETALESGGSSAAVASTSRRSPDEALTLARSLGAFFARGGRVDWERWFGGPARRVPLPAYPWDATVLRRTLPRAVPSVRPATVTRVRTDLTDAIVSLRGLTPVPPVVHLSALDEAVTTPTAHAAATAAPGTVVLEDVRVVEMIEAPDDGDLILEVSTEEAGGSLRAEVRAPRGPGLGGLTGLTARVRVDPHPPAAGHARDRVDAALGRCTTHLTQDRFLEALARRGYTPGPNLRTIRHVWRTDGEVVAQLDRPIAARHAAWEGCLKLLLAALPASLPAGAAYAVSSFDRVRFLGPLSEEAWVHATLSAHRSDGTALGEVVVTDPRGEVLAEFHGIHLLRLAGGETATAPGRAPLDLVQWSTRRLAAMARLPLLALSQAVDRLPAPPRPAPATAPTASVAATPAPASGNRTSTVRTEPAPAPVPGPVRGPVRGPALVPGAGAADLVADPAFEQFLEEAAHVLGMARESLDLRRTLHDYGMDSLSAAQLRTRTRHRTGRDVALNRLLGGDSLRTLAAAVTDTRLLHG